jgi:Gluconate 2-dehydrogenase subunit 3
MVKCLKKFSRRQFIELGMVTSVASRVAWINEPSGTETFPGLRAAMDRIIPAEGDLPSASQAGCIPYIESLAARDSNAARKIQEAMKALEGLSQSLFQSEFTSISADRLDAALTRLEATNPELFRGFRDLVYEAYYVQPQVWARIDYKFYPTDGAGPAAPPFDAEILSNVRRRPSNFRPA